MSLAITKSFVLLLCMQHFLATVSSFSTTLSCSNTHAAILRQSQKNDKLKISCLSMSDKDQQEKPPRSEALRKSLSALGEVSDGEMTVGSTVVTGNNIPNLGIWQFQSYELTSIYDQGTTEDGAVEKIPRKSLEEAIQPPNYKRYVTLYSEKHHPDGIPVIVSPDEVELSSMQQEVISSLLQAMPLFVFWTALAFSFANQYSQRTGGTFVDALFGR